MPQAKTIFDYIKPTDYRFVHICRRCDQPQFSNEREPAEECVRCGNDSFHVVPYYNPDQDYGLDVDYYAITMMYALWKEGLHKTQVVYDDFYRKAPFVKGVGDFSGELGGYVAFGGLGHLIETINNLHFSEADLDYLRQQPEGFEEAFLEDLRKLRFSGDMYAVEEGNLVFPNTPLIRLEAPVWECIWIEAMLLNIINAESLVLTKGSRIKTIAGKDGLLEMGKRRAQGRDASVYGAKMAYIAGFDATSNVKAGKQFSMPITGTQAHVYIMFHPSELEAFLAYANVFPQKTIPLLDTTDTLNSGLPHAITTARKLQEKGFEMTAVRLDSGDLAYLSKKVRKRLDEEGLEHVKIAATNDLDEYTIASLKQQGAQIDIWGVGTKFITAYDNPALGGVHKIVARRALPQELRAGIYNEDDWIPLIKISESIEKILNPGRKKVYRLFGPDGMAKGDYICLAHESLEGQSEIVLKHPTNPLKAKKIRDFEAVELHKQIFKQGKCVYDVPTLEEVRAYHQRQKNTFWEEYLRLEVPEVYPVSLSDELRNMKERLIEEKRQHDDG
ncbi:nicotinate phosphoribosyltransferase [Shouchella clausii]|uniref:nicotinate phosphoribosyltransferase n=1 Tax=Shouchella clausii TaxID=79880 RepID=UPI001B0AF3A2|nr:nicotinate phosphoribosyltransferase [Shouchella clausii]MCM3311301.1 nicotinate phosphoribosyltransferase [Psychrobacillus sp. MER TA 17]GIN07712.1 nicotinate phosphoribosyltransferase [Shouchella clausii]